MANTKISNLTASASNLAASDLVPVVQTPGVGPVKMTGTQIKTGIIGAGSVSIASGKTFTSSNTLTLAGTDSTTITFGSASSSFPIVTSPTAATLQLGAADVATTAVAQTLQVQSNTGAANGPDFTIKGSNSGAANTGGNINFQLADAGAYSTQLYLRTDKVAVFGSSTSSAFNVQVRQSSSGITVSNNGGAATARMTGDRTGSGGGARIHVGSNAEIGWNDATTLTSSAFDTILTRGGAAATLQLGAADAAAPVAQFFKVQGVVAGTSNTAGANFTIQGSQGTGTGAGGSIIFQVAPVGVAGTTQNAYQTAFQINGNGGVTGQDGVTANTLALRNGTNAQTFRVYNTFTSFGSGTEIWERGTIEWSSNVLRIATSAGANGGSVRPIEVQVGTVRKFSFTTVGSFELFNSTTRESYQGWDAFTVRSDTFIGWASSTSVSQGQGDTNFIRTGVAIIGVRGANTTTGGALSFIEQTAPAAPAANGVYIYAEDNGSGKTRLMALFATGAAQQIAIEP